MEVISPSDLEQITSRKTTMDHWSEKRREHLEKTREKVLPGREGWKDTWVSGQESKH